jgi:hypothetical protein
VSSLGGAPVAAVPAVGGLQGARGARAGDAIGRVGQRRAVAAGAPVLAVQHAAALGRAAAALPRLALRAHGCGLASCRVGKRRVGIRAARGADARTRPARMQAGALRRRERARWIARWTASAWPARQHARRSASGGERSGRRACLQRAAVLQHCCLLSLFSYVCSSRWLCLLAGRAGTSSAEDSLHAGRAGSSLRSRGSGGSAGPAGEGRVRGGLPRSASIAARLASSAGPQRLNLSSSRCAARLHGVLIRVWSGLWSLAAPEPEQLAVRRPLLQGPAQGAEAPQRRDSAARGALVSRQWCAQGLLRLWSLAAPEA